MVEKETSPEWLWDDTVAGALARREKFLGKEWISPAETMLKMTYMSKGSMTEARAIDKLTAQTLYQQRFPGNQGLLDQIYKETGAKSLDNGLVVYRLADGDWIEPIVHHYIPSCFPWAQALEWDRAHPQAENDGQSPIPNLQQKTAGTAKAITQKSSH